MTTHAPDFTPRLVVKYQSAGLNHSNTFRVARGSATGPAIETMSNAAQALYNSLESLLPVGFNVTDQVYYNQDSNVGFPQGTAGFVQPTGAKLLADYTPMMRATETVFIGNGGGAPYHIGVFGVFWDPSDVTGPAANGRVGVGESTVIEDAYAALAANGGISSIVGVAIAWKTYATVKPNDYWVRQVRKLFL